MENYVNYLKYITVLLKCLSLCQYVLMHESVNEVFLTLSENFCLILEEEEAEEELLLAGETETSQEVDATQDNNDVTEGTVDEDEVRGTDGGSVNEAETSEVDGQGWSNSLFAFFEQAENIKNIIEKVKFLLVMSPLY